MDRRRGAAVSLCNSTDRLALRIACRNGVPFALRNFGHVYSWFNSISQRGLHASFQGAGSYPLRDIRQTSDAPPQTPPGILSANRKLPLTNLVMILTISRYRPGRRQLGSLVSFGARRVALLVEASA